MKRHKAGSRRDGCSSPCSRDRHCKCANCVPRSATGPTGPCCTGPTGAASTGPTGPCCTGPGGPAGPPTPTIGARVSGPEQIALDGVPTVVTFDAERFDFGNVWDPLAPTRLTAPVSGLYQISGSVNWEAEAAGVRILTIRLDGVTPIVQDTRSPAPATFITGQPVGTSYQLVAGQYVELVATQISGEDLSILDVPATSPEFSLVLISPT